MATAPANPLMKLTSDLDDALRFRSLSATEEMGRLFEFSVLAVSDADAEVDPASPWSCRTTASATSMAWWFAPGSNPPWAS